MIVEQTDAITYRSIQDQVDSLTKIREMMVRNMYEGQNENNIGAINIPDKLITIVKNAVNSLSTRKIIQEIIPPNIENKIKEVNRSPVKLSESQLRESPNKVPLISTKVPQRLQSAPVKHTVILPRVIPPKKLVPVIAFGVSSRSRVPIPPKKAPTITQPIRTFVQPLISTTVNSPQRSSTTKLSPNRPPPFYNVQTTNGPVFLRRTTIPPKSPTKFYTERVKTTFNEPRIIAPSEELGNRSIRIFRDLEFEVGVVKPILKVYDGIDIARTDVKSVYVRKNVDKEESPDAIVHVKLVTDMPKHSNPINEQVQNEVMIPDESISPLPVDYAIPVPPVMDPIQISYSDISDNDFEEHVPDTCIQEAKNQKVAVKNLSPKVKTFEGEKSPRISSVRNSTQYKDNSVHADISEVKSNVKIAHRSFSNTSAQTQSMDILQIVQDTKGTQSEKEVVNRVDNTPPIVSRSKMQKDVVVQSLIENVKKSESSPEIAAKSVELSIESETETSDESKSYQFSSIESIKTPEYKQVAKKAASVFESPSQPVRALTVVPLVVKNIKKIIEDDIKKSAVVDTTNNVEKSSSISLISASSVERSVTPPKRYIPRPPSREMSPQQEGIKSIISSSEDSIQLDESNVHFILLIYIIL